MMKHPLVAPSVKLPQHSNQTEDMLQMGDVVSLDGYGTLGIYKRDHVKDKLVVNAMTMLTKEQAKEIAEMLLVWSKKKR